MSVTLKPTTLDLLDAEDVGVEVLARALDAACPPLWPPDFNGDAYRQWQRALLRATPDEPNYAGWYLIAKGELVGTCGFKGPPDANGEVEIGYSVIAPRQGRGFASAAVRQLVDLAFADSRVRCVSAETTPDAAASQAVLRNCGFVASGGRIDPDDGEVRRFVRNRP